MYVVLKNKNRMNVKPKAVANKGVEEIEETYVGRHY